MVAGRGRGYGEVDLGPTELIIVLVIVLVLFGGAKLPKLAKSLGEAHSTSPRRARIGCDQRHRDVHALDPRFAGRRRQACGLWPRRLTLPEPVG